MALYESVFIARQDISSSQVDALADSFQKIIEDGGGQVPKREYWGLRSLAYKIKKNRKGHYVLFNIDSPSGAVLEFERNMKLNEDILRYMTLRVDELDPEPSVVMQGRGRSDHGERGERGRRFGERPRDGDKRPEAAKTDTAKPAETKTAEPEKTDVAKQAETKAAKPTEAVKPDAEAVDEKAPKTAAKTAKKTSAKKTDDDKKKDAKPAKSEKSTPDDKKDKKAAPAKKEALAKEDKKPAVVKKKAAATKKKGEEA